MAHDGSFPCDFHTAGDAFSAVVYVLQSCCNHIHVVVGVYATGYAEAYEVVAAEAVLAGDGVAVGEDVTDFAGADTGFAIKLYGEGLCREFLFRHMGENLVGIYEDGVAAGGR